MRTTAAATYIPFLLLLFSSSCYLPSPASALTTDGVLLLSFKYALLADPLSALSGWSYADDSPCAWNGVVCAGFPSTQDDANATDSSAGTTVSRVISLILPGARLLGRLPPELGLIEHLRHLDLSANAINGTLPPSLFNASELRLLDLSRNDISGAIPDVPSGALRGLQVLNLSDNALVGALPDNLTQLPDLLELALSNNLLAGELPAGGLGSLQLFDVSANLFNGTIPADLGGRSLRFLNLSSNRLQGAIPAALASIVPANATVDLSNNNLTGAIPEVGAFSVQRPESYSGNDGLCGPPLKVMCTIPSTLSNPPNISAAPESKSPPAFAAIPENPDGIDAGGGSPGAPQQAGSTERLRPATILAIVTGDVLGIALLFAVFLYVYNAKRKSRREQQLQQPPAPFKDGRGAAGLTLQSQSKDELKASSSLSCCLRGKQSDGSEGWSSSETTDTEDEKSKELKKGGGGGSQFHGKIQDHQAAKKSEPPAATTVAPTLVTVDGDGELELETLLKASAYILGATGSSIVYKAVLADGTALAVRRIGESGGADRLRDFEAQVRNVARYRHPNILRLRGFYWGADEKLLIHDYAPNGSLANVAFNKRHGTSSPFNLNWEARLRIARGVARGLAYLHEKKCVHGNVKPSNVLLSADLDPWIADLMLDRLMSSEGGGEHRPGSSARLFGSKRSMHSTSSLPDLSQMPGASPSSSSVLAPPAPYQAPECLKNLKPNAKWDVYSFGMVLLEQIAGRVFSEVELCQWHSGFVPEETSRVIRMADPSIRADIHGKEEAVLSCFRLGIACCAMAPHRRPTMKEAVVVLDRLA